MSKTDQIQAAVQEPPQEEERNIPKVKASKDSKLSKLSTKHFGNANITLTEDCFGANYYEDGTFEKIQRFTWKNHNSIEVEVITYGARIVSMRMPDKNKVVEDIALGFRDLAGYTYYDNYQLGATIGRVASYVENSTFVIDDKQYWLNSNNGKHHYNGGFHGLDKVIWTPYVDGTKVIMSYTCPDGTEGYPGDLLVRITYELSTKNEFSINMEAITTKPTIVNLSNLLYFNLAGHSSGPGEIYNHTVTINANCYTMYDDDKFPTGDIQNVYNTVFDFQQPVILKGCLGVNPDDGFDQNWCVNRGIHQDLGFVARALHVPSGRILEVYSNQCGVNFSTANNFGTGQVNIPVPVIHCDYDDTNEENIFIVLDHLYELMLETADITTSPNLEHIRQLLMRIKYCKFKGQRCISNELVNVGEITEYDTLDNFDDTDINLSQLMTRLQLNYLDAIKDVACQVGSNTTCLEVQRIVDNIISVARSFDKPEESMWISPEPDVSGEINDENRYEALQASKAALHKLGAYMQETFPFDVGSRQASGSKQSGDVYLSASKEGARKRRSTQGLKPTNEIPSFYKDGRIHGKNNAIYKRHCAIAFQTQNYPNAIYHPNFPNSALRPGETYTHTIVYKLWVQSGNPRKWMKRQKCLKE